MKNKQGYIILYYYFFLERVRIYNIYNYSFFVIYFLRFLLISQLGNHWEIFQPYSPKALDPFMRVKWVKSRKKIIPIAAIAFFKHEHLFTLKLFLILIFVKCYSSVTFVTKILQCFVIPCYHCILQFQKTQSLYIVTVKFSTFVKFCLCILFW